MGKHKGCNNECDTCPFNFFSEESNLAQNYGCLPTPYEVKRMYNELDGVWGCHDTSLADGDLSPCKGFISWMHSKGTPIKIKNKVIIDYPTWTIDKDYFSLK